MKKLILILLLIAACSPAFGQTTTYLQNIRNRTKAELGQIVSGVTIPSKSYWETYVYQQLGVNLTAAIEARSLTPLDFTTFAIGMDTARVRLRPYFVPSGTYNTSTPLAITSELRIDGFSGTRIRDDLSNVTGSIIKSTSSTSNDTTGIIQSSFQGIHLYNLLLQGNSRTNSNGYYAYRQNSPTNNTLGGYSISNSSAYNNGKSGFNIEASDGNYFWNLNSYGNGAYGLKITSPAGNGKYENDAAASAGTTNVFMSGRHRKNSLGGIYNYSTKGNIFLGVQSITDSTFNFSSYSTRGMIQQGVDYEFAVPPRLFSGAQPRAYNYVSELDRAKTVLGGYIGSIHTHSSSLTADSGTDTDTIIDAALTAMPDNYYIGYEVTVGAETREVTDYVRSTNTLELASAIIGLTNGTSYSLTRHADVGILAKDLASSVWINTTFPSQADTIWSGWGSYANAIFINPVNFDPRTEIKNRTAGTTKYFLMDLDNFSTSAQFVMASNSEWFMQTISDSLILRGGGGVRIESDTAAVDLQPAPPNDSGTTGDVYWSSAITNELRPDFRWYFDANVASGALNKKYVFFRGSSGQSNAMTFGGSDDSVRAVYSMPFEMSGNSGTARYFDVLAQTAIPTTIAVLTNRVRVSAKQDKLWTYDDNGDSLNITPYNGSDTWNPANLTAGSTDSATVAVTNAAVGDVVMVGHSGITGTNANIHLFGHVISAGSVRVFARNESGGTYDIPSGTVKVRVWK